MRSSYNALETSSSSFLDDTQSSEMTEECVIEVSPESFSQQSLSPKLHSPTTSVPKRKRHSSNNADVDNVFSEAVGAFRKLCESKEANKNEESKDPLHGFAKMIVTTIATMSSVKQINAIQRVTALVMAIKLEPEE